MQMAVSASREWVLNQEKDTAKRRESRLKTGREKGSGSAENR